jgi:energy-coupling factor transport system substrate-specific component
MSARRLAILTEVLTHALGLGAFLYPFFLRSVPNGGERLSHAGDAPVLFSVLGVLLLVLAVADVRGGRLSAKQIALLGILSSLNAMVRIPGALGGASLMFVLPILCGYAFGARFGFLLGATSMAASAVITGGIGPWLPFQMWALGWVGGGAGLLRRFVKNAAGPAALAALSLYGWISGLAFGVIINLWFWPFLRGEADVSWVPGASAAVTASHYWRFYLLTSLAWDSARALANALLILFVGRPLLRLLVRFRDRLVVAWRPGETTRQAGSTIEA